MCAFARDPVLQACEHLKPAAASLGEALGRAAHHKRHPDLCVVVEPAEARRHDTDDGEGPSVEENRPADDLRITAEGALPETIAEHGDGDLLRHDVLVGAKDAAMRRLDAEQREVRRRDHLASDPLRLVPRRERDARPVEGGHCIEGRGAGAPVDEIGIGCASPLEFCAHHVAPQDDEPVGVRVWQCAASDRVDETEDRRVAADSDRQREHSDRGKAGRSPQRTRGVSYVLPDAFERRENPHVAHLLLVAKRKERFR